MAIDTAHVPQNGTGGANEKWPYIPFRTFYNVVERLEEIGLGNRVDKSTLRNLSYSTITQVLSTLKVLGLIAADGKPLPDLVALVEHPETRKPKVAEILKRHYKSIFDRDLAGLTPDELEQELRGLSADTKRKAATFFVHAAAYAEIAMSPLLAMKFKAQQAGVPRRTTSGSRPRGKKAGKSKPTGQQAQQQTSQGQPNNFKSMVLEDGGVLGLTLTSADLFSMSKRDRDFVLGLVDKMAEHEEASPRKAVLTPAQEPAATEIGA